MQDTARVNFLFNWFAGESEALQETARNSGKYLHLSNMQSCFDNTVILMWANGTSSMEKLSVLESQRDYRNYLKYQQRKAAMTAKFAATTRLTTQLLIQDGTSVSPDIWEQLPPLLQLHYRPSEHSLVTLTPEIQEILDMLIRQPTLDLLGVY